MPESRESAVNDAYAAVIAWQREAQEALWRAPSRRQVEATIRAQFDRAEAAEARLLELENAASWMTSCTSCARVLDSAYAETMRREQAEALLAEVREVIATYFTVHGNSTSASLTMARDLAEAVRQVLDRVPLEALGGKEEES